jgi:hypothetical protein
MQEIYIHKICFKFGFIFFLTWNKVRTNFDIYECISRSIIHHPLTELEFETAWSMMLEDFHLHDNITLNKMYGIRKDWCLPF